MKRNCILLLISHMLFFSIVTVAQTTQMKRWYMAPYQVNVENGSFPVSSLIPGLSPTAMQMHAVNGLYDANHNMLFYVSDNNVFDYNNTLIGTISPGMTAAEIAIVPFGDNIPQSAEHCNNKYNIFSLTGNAGAGTLYLVKSILDMANYSLTSNIIDNLPANTVETGGLAISPVFANGERYLYYLGGGGTLGSSSGEIHQLQIHNNGTVSVATKIYPPAQYANISVELMSNELDISPDGQWLAWASWHGSNNYPTSRYYYLQLYAPVNTPNQALWGTFIPGTFHAFNIPGLTGSNTANGFRGIEFYNDPNNSNQWYLLMGAGTDGVYETDIPNTTAFAFVTGSNMGFGNSQLEMANNGYIYAGSATGLVGAIDANPLVLNLVGGFWNFSINNPPPSTALGGDPFYTLPDQLDGEDYDPITVPFFSPVATIGSYTAVPGAPVTWSYSGGANPWNISSGPIHVISEIIIPTGANVTISGMTFDFSPAAKIKIETGATLTLDNSTLTGGNCSNMWRGIEVAGNKLLSQMVATNQGKLIIRNNSTIADAIIGVSLWDRANALSAGGMLQATNSTFINNQKSVEFWPYANFNPTTGKPASNNSYFTNCSFNVNDAYRGYNFTTAVPFDAHVTIWGCDGISFTNCYFQNQANTGNTNLLGLGEGIHSLDGGFRVKANGCPVCSPTTYCPCSNRSSFSGLKVGIHAGKTSNSIPFFVDQTDFNSSSVAANYSNGGGILNNAVNNIKVKHCEFEIGKNLLGINYGMETIGSDGFTIEENDFYKPASATQLAYGSIIWNSGAGANQVYKNSYTNLFTASYGYNYCRNSSFPATSGLQFLCNDYHSNSYDILSNFQLTANNGIRLNQGDASHPAGNTFSGSTSNVFNISGGPVLNYFYDGSSSSQNPALYNSLVIPMPIGHNRSCPSHYDNGNGQLTPEMQEELKAIYDTSEAAYMNLWYVYNQLIDDGNTNLFITQFLNANADAWQIRNDLLAQAPDLSEDVLREVAINSTLPMAMKLEIMLATPDATRNEEFLNYLQNEISPPFPEYMIDQIRASWDEATSRTYMESMLAYYNSMMGYASNSVSSSSDGQPACMGRGCVVIFLIGNMTCARIYCMLHNVNK